MDFDWPQQSSSLRAEAVSFAASLNDGVSDDDRAARFPVEKWRRLAEWGYFGLSVPSELGGAEIDPLTGLLVTEGLGEGCHDGGLLFSAAVQAWVVIRALLAYASDSQKRRFVPGLAAGSTIGAFAVTEPDSGSDAFAMRTRAQRVDGGWSISGRKSLITNAPHADLVVCFAATGTTGALGGTSVFLVETGLDGVERSPSTDKMGLRTSPIGDVVFDEVRVGDDSLLGKVGTGLLIFNEVLEWERIWPSALQLGALARDLDNARNYARQREAFGAPIASYQSVANRIVDMSVRLEAARLLTYRAAWLKASGRPAGAESAMAKLSVSEAAVESTLDAIQVHGGYGYMTEYGVERRLRDAVGGRIYSGTSEMQRVVLSRSMGL